MSHRLFSLGAGCSYTKYDVRTVFVNSNSTHAQHLQAVPHKKKGTAVRHEKIPKQDARRLRRELWQHAIRHVVPLRGGPRRVVSRVDEDSDPQHANPQETVN